MELCVNAAEAGFTGILDLTRSSAAEASAAVKALTVRSGTLGLKLDGSDAFVCEAIAAILPSSISLVIFSFTDFKSGRFGSIKKLFGGKGVVTAIEVTSLDEARSGVDAGYDLLVAKGSESGGRTGSTTSFVLLQALVSNFKIPVWVQGGVGLSTAAACYAGGASGVLLDAQLFLTAESPLPEEVKKTIARMDGGEPSLICQSAPYRAYCRHGSPLPAQLAAWEDDLSLKGDIQGWHNRMRSVIGWGADNLWPIGQDIGFATRYSKFKTVSGVLKAFRASVGEHIRAARSVKPLAPGSLLARSIGMEYPVFQGPMARVSDSPEFAMAVSDGGALPFMALSTLKSDEITPMLSATAELLKGRPWGIGILGFNGEELLNEQLEAAYPFSPGFAVIAGGKPGQVSLLESKGIRSYVHIPSPSLLEMFVEAGARRFIFEGSECGGHIGPRSSFVLWEGVIEKLKSIMRVFKISPSEVELLFAGGIHDARSALMVSALTAKLAEKGASIGVLMGTAYLFTSEITGAGAITRSFQKEAVQCVKTSVLEISPGHLIRCTQSPFVKAFEELKKKMRAGKASPDEIRSKLEEMVLGRSRIASKGLRRNPGFGKPGEPYLAPADEKTQLSEGLFMVGQAATLHEATFSVKDLHEDVSMGSTAMLAALPLPSWAEGNAGVAIIGMSCFLPGSPGLKDYWERILDKDIAIRDVPSDRWNASVYFDADPSTKDRVYAKRGGFLDDILFDPLRYGMPPNSLSSVEPLHLMALEAVRHALRDAGYEEKEFSRETTSVIIGTGGGIGELGQSYVVRSALPEFFEGADDVSKDLPEWTEDSFPGILMNVMAGRVANRFNFGGVNYTVDAACASSIAALYDAVRELDTRTSDMVIAGGADAGQNPFAYLCFSKTHALSPGGNCRVFDEKADGTVISEGLCFLVLKRLPDAQMDGDRIYAVIKSVAGSSDGRQKGLTAPNPLGQLSALRRAYSKAGFDPATLGLLEAHGTGTVVGDRVEAESAGLLLKEHKARQASCAIGSVKSVIGHTKGAAGLAGVIKTALALYHKVLPPTASVQKPNSAEFHDGPIYINSEARPWIRKPYPRRAGVNAFGFGGTNFHAVLEEYSCDASGASSRDKWSNELFIWAAKSRAELLQTIQSVHKALSQGAEARLSDLSFTICSGFENNSDNRARLSIVASSVADLKSKIEAASSALKSAGETFTDPGGISFTEKPLGVQGEVAFLFPGQGSQYPDMVKELAVIFPEVREAFERADKALKGLFENDLSSYVFPVPSFTPEGEKAARKALLKTNIAQSALGSASMGVLSLLRSFGIAPNMAAGHSYGEYAALCASGSIDEESLFRVSEARGRSMIEAAQGQDLGTMAAVKAGKKEVEEALAGFDSVVIANINSPRQTVISGSKDAIAKAVALMEAKGLQAQTLQVSGAFHSPLVAPAKKMFSEFLSGISFNGPSFAVFSNNSAEAHKGSPDGIREALVEHIVRPVRFVDEIEAMYGSGARIFIEVGAGGVLTGLTRQILEGREFAAASTDSAGFSLSQFLKCLGMLVVNGVEADLSRLFKGRAVEALGTELSAKAEVVPATAWLVNGSGARPYGKPAIEKHRERIDLSKENISTPGAHVIEHGAMPAHPNGANPAETHKVMMQFQQMMSRFLETQKNVMASYLGGAAPEAEFARPSTTQKTPAVEIKAQPAALKIVESVKKEDEKKQASVQAATSGSASTKEELAAILLKIAGERTGYPVEMLKTDVDMEAELGIDSIKRVEILNAFSKAVPEGARENIRSIVDELSRLKTLNAVVQRSFDALKTSAPKEAKPLAAPTLSVSAEELSSILLKITGERTGYPVEMLKTDVDMEAELGIDSIKRVEILNAFSKAVPEGARESIRSIVDELSRLKTLNAVVQRSFDALKTFAPKEVKPSAAPTQSVAAEELSSVLLKITGERTGYPVEMLKTDVDMEAELGIDSIKRVEILNAFSKAVPEGVRENIRSIVDELSRLKTLNAVVQRSFEALSSISGAPRASEAGASAPIVHEPTIVVPRLLHSYEAAPAQAGQLTFPSDAVVLITDDGRGVAEALERQISSRGGKAVIIKNGPQLKNGAWSFDIADYRSVQENVVAIRKEHGPIAGLVHLVALGARTPFSSTSLPEWKGRLGAEVKGLFNLAKALKEDLIASGARGFGWLFAATAIEYLDGAAGMTVGQDGICGFLKSASQEWPELACRALNLEMSNPPEILAGQIISEMAIRQPHVEIGYQSGERVAYSAKVTAVGKANNSFRIDKDWVIVITGGARGITAEIAQELAARYSPRLVLIGRSPMPEDEPSWTKGLSSKVEMKSAIAAKLKESGSDFSIADIESRCSSIAAGREIRENIAKIQSAGSEVRYIQGDVRDEAGFGAIIDSIYSQYGRIDGFVHGAGVIEDKLIEDKTPESFDRVFDTKTDSSFILSAKLKSAQLKFLVFFTSVAGFFGNRGQADYAAANEVVNGLARHLDKAWPGRVVAINWGPWDKTGMVTPEIKKQFADRGIQLVPPDAGRRMFIDELERGRKGEVEVVVGGGPWAT